MARRCQLALRRPYDSRAIRRGQYFVSKYGSSFNLYFHCCYRCCYMYIVDVNKDVNSDFLFFSAFLDLYSIRDDEDTSKELIFFNALTDVLIASRKTPVSEANNDVL